MINKISERLESLFRDYGLTPPTQSTPFTVVIERLLNSNQNEDKLNYLVVMYNSLVELGLDSPFFEQVRLLVLLILSGG